MTQEEKAKEFDASLERAKKLIETCDSTAVIGWCEYIFPMLKESKTEDEKIRKEIIDFLWEEKIFLQEAHSSVENSPKYRFVMDAIAWLEKQGEQNHTDKVKPKFGIGDYLVNDYCKGKVIALTDDAYLLDTGQGMPFSCEHNIHLWSIFDARDGDVLVDVYGNIGIYEKCYDFDWMSYCSLGYNGGFQHFKIEHENEKTYPATKEQQNLLFSKMQEDGWYWNPETKELSQSQVTKSECWSEEDDYNLQCMIAKAVKDIQNGNVGRNQELIDWLKSLKNRIQPRQNACGEEQDNVTSMIKAHCVKLT